MPIQGLKPEDYLEPECIFCKPETVLHKPVDLRRCLTKLDAYLDRNDLAGAARHLDYWKQEALTGNDDRGLLTIENERMGLYRKMGKEPEAMEAALSALRLIGRAGLEDTVTAATTWLNVGTVYKNFGRSPEALPYYERARTIYERELKPEDPNLAGLYNNMALALADCARFSEARELYEKASAILTASGDGLLERAVTELNLANLDEAERGLLEAEAEIDGHLDRAKALLDDPATERNGYYAFVCDKCAPTFGYYGRFADAQELKERAEAIYAGT